jgi:hypothetical protein
MQAKTKSFDCVAMKHEIQARLAALTAGMSPAQVREFYDRKSEESRAALAQRPDAGKGNFKALFEAFDREQEKRGNL